jgi:diguanylate cyclase (GGDEF)-like protein
MSLQTLASPHTTLIPEFLPEKADSRIQALRGRLEIFKCLLEAFREPCFLFDRRWKRLLAVNVAAGKWSGYSRKDLVHGAYREVFAPWDETAIRNMLFESCTKMPLKIRVPAVSKSGKSRRWLWSVQKLGDRNRGAILVRLVRRRVAEGTIPILMSTRTGHSPYTQGNGLTMLPGRDPLTGLADRALFARHLARVFPRARKNPNDHFAVLFLDLDRFKAINDVHGHRTGDRVLRCAARRLVGAVRPGDLAARYGGDEFTVFLDHVSNPTVVVEAAQRILDRLNRTLRIAGREFALSTSIGIVVFRPEYENYDEMLDAADQAMYQAKSQGGGRFWIKK